MNDQDRITQLEAACAAKDKALESAWAGMWDGHYSGKGVTKEYAQAVDREVKSALSADAGKSLLERLQAAESRLAEWETLRTNDAATHQNILRGIIALTRPQALHLAGAQDYDELKDRLQAVEKERDRLRKACVGMVAWWNTPERDQPEKLPIRIRDCEQAISADAGKSLLDKYQYHLTDNQRLKGELERVCDLLKDERELRKSALAGHEVLRVELRNTQDRLQAVEKERDRYKAALEKLWVGDFVGTSLNEGCGAMRVIEDALSWSDEEVQKFIKEYDEGKHPLSAEDEAALERSREKLMRRIRKAVQPEQKEQK